MRNIPVYAFSLILICFSKAYFAAEIESLRRVERSPDSTSGQASRGNFFKAKLAVRSDQADDDTENPEALKTNAISYDKKPAGFLSLRRLTKPATSLVGFSSRLVVPRSTTAKPSKEDPEQDDKLPDLAFSETQKYLSSPYIPQVAPPSFTAKPKFGNQNSDRDVQLDPWQLPATQSDQFQSPTTFLQSNQIRQPVDQHQFQIKQQDAIQQQQQQQIPQSQSFVASQPDQIQQAPAAFDFQKQQEGLIQPEPLSSASEQPAVLSYNPNSQQPTNPLLESRTDINFIPAGLQQNNGASSALPQVQQQPQFVFPQMQQQSHPTQQIGGFPMQPSAGQFGQFFPQQQMRPQQQQQLSNMGFSPNFPQAMMGSGRQDAPSDPSQGGQFINQPGANGFSDGQGQQQFVQAPQFPQPPANDQAQAQTSQQVPLSQFQDPSQQTSQFQSSTLQQPIVPPFQPGAGAQFVPQADQAQFSQVPNNNFGAPAATPNLFDPNQQQSSFAQPTSQANIFQQAPLPPTQFNQFLTPEQIAQQQQQQPPQPAAATFQNPSNIPFIPQADQNMAVKFEQDAATEIASQQQAQQQQQQQQQAQQQQQFQSPQTPSGGSTDGFFLPNQQQQQQTGPPPPENPQQAQQRSFVDPVGGAPPMPYAQGRDAYGASGQPGYANGGAGPQGYAGGGFGATQGGYGQQGAGGYGGHGGGAYGQPGFGRYSPFAGGSSGGAGFGYPSGGSPYPYGAYGGFGYGYRPYYLGYNYDLAPYGIPQTQDFVLYSQNTLHPEKSYYRKGPDYQGAQNGAYGKSDYDTPYGKAMPDNGAAAPPTPSAAA